MSVKIDQKNLCYVCVQAWEDFHEISELDYFGDCGFVYYFAWVVVRMSENKVLRIFNVVCDELSYLRCVWSCKLGTNKTVDISSTKVYIG